MLAKSPLGPLHLLGLTTPAEGEDIYMRMLLQSLEFVRLQPWVTATY